MDTFCVISFMILRENYGRGAVALPHHGGLAIVTGKCSESPILLNAVPDKVHVGAGVRAGGAGLLIIGLRRRTGC